jgi:nucleoside-triphosphatase THEP1
VLSVKTATTLVLMDSVGKLESMTEKALEDFRQALEPHKSALISMKYPIKLNS